MKIVMIAVDTLRADHLSCYGYHRQTSPNIDAIAREGFVFTNCFAVSNCTHPGFTAIFAGLYPETSGIVSHWSAVDLADDRPMLAEILGRHGLVTAAVDNLYDAWRKGHRLYPWFRRGYERYDFPREKHSHSSKNCDLACQWIRELAQSDFFLLYHPWHPHAPYEPPDECRVFRAASDDPIEQKVALYDAEIYFTDIQVGRVVRALKDAGIYDDTLLIVTSDHGEIMGEERVVLGARFNFGHIDLHDECLRVPLIWRWPKRIRAGQSDALVQQPDILPTLLELADIPCPPVDGVSLAPVMAGKRWSRETAHFLENTYQKKRGMRTRRHKFLRHYEEQLQSVVRRELYDLEADPLEQVNEVDRQPELARELNARMEQWVREMVQKAARTVDPLVEQPITNAHFRESARTKESALSHVYSFAARLKKSG